jgi:hypothetical protein
VTEGMSFSHVRNDPVKNVAHHKITSVRHKLWTVYLPRYLGRYFKTPSQSDDKVSVVIATAKLLNSGLFAQSFLDLGMFPDVLFCMLHPRLTIRNCRIPTPT